MASMSDVVCHIKDPCSKIGEKNTVTGRWKGAYPEAQGEWALSIPQIVQLGTALFYP